MDNDLDAVWKALSDPTRRAILDLLHKGWGEYWQLVFGPLLVIIALYARGGMASLMRGRE